MRSGLRRTARKREYESNWPLKTGTASFSNLILSLFTCYGNLICKVSHMRKMCPIFALRYVDVGASSHYELATLYCFLWYCRWTTLPQKPWSFKRSVKLRSSYFWLNFVISFGWCMLFPLLCMVETRPVLPHLIYHFVLFTLFLCDSSLDFLARTWSTRTGRTGSTVLLHDHQRNTGSSKSSQWYVERQSLAWSFSVAGQSFWDWTYCCLWVFKFFAVPECSMMNFSSSDTAEILSSGYRKRSQIMAAHARDFSKGGIILSLSW